MSYRIDQNLQKKKEIYKELLEKKITFCNEKLIKDPQDIESYFQLSDIAINSSQFELSDTFLKVADTIKPFSTKLLIRKVNNFIKIGNFEKAHSLIKRFYYEQNLYDDLKDNPKILSYFSNILLTVFADYEGSLKLSLDSIKRFPKIEEGYKSLAENYIYFYGDLLQGRRILIESINKFHSTLLAESYIKSFFLNNPKAGLYELIKLKKAGLFSKNAFKILYFNIMSFIGNLQSQLDSLMEIKDYIDEDQFDYERLSLNPSYINEISLDILQHKIKFVEDELSFELDHNNKKTLSNKLYYLKIIIARKFFKKKKINDEFKFLEEAKEIYFKKNFHCSTNHTPPIKIKSMPMTLFNDQNEYVELVKKNKLISYDYSPIFIIGLPRSGSTLIESIISGSKDIISCDESQIILKFKNYIKFINKKKSIMEMYINNFPEISNFKRFTDKSLNNFANIDLIIQLFPKAKFINCVRNPKENAIAIFKNNFDTLPWSLNIKSILKYMDEYFKLINHYKKKYKEKIYTLDHKNLVCDKQNTSKKLFEFLGIKWKPEFLDIHKKKFTTGTSSKRQIKKKISKSFLNK